MAAMPPQVVACILSAAAISQHMISLRVPLQVASIPSRRVGPCPPDPWMPGGPGDHGAVQLLQHQPPGVVDPRDYSHGDAQQRPPFNPYPTGEHMLETLKQSKAWTSLGLWGEPDVQGWGASGNANTTVKEHLLQHNNSNNNNMNSGSETVHPFLAQDTTVSNALIARSGSSRPFIRSGELNTMADKEDYLGSNGDAYNTNMYCKASRGRKCAIPSDADGHEEDVIEVFRAAIALTQMAVNCNVGGGRSTPRGRRRSRCTKACVMDGGEARSEWVPEPFRLVAPWAGAAHVPSTQSLGTPLMVRGITIPNYVFSKKKNAGAPFALLSPLAGGVPVTCLATACGWSDAAIE